MRAHKSEKFTTAPWRVPVAVENIPDDGQRFSLVADADVRAGIARMAGLRDLPRLEADFEVTRQGSGGLRVIGLVSATVGQNCVATLEPVVNAVDEDVVVLFIPQAAAQRTGENDMDGSAADVKWDDPEPLIGGVVDLGALATEFLVLGLDPYPRKPGAVFEPAPEFKSDGGPFAALAGWTKSRKDG
jgi:hypothetical protein